ncbi:hypothetical protein [Nocardiopsis sp. FR4]|uniref:hypothetical protein n=1 Tax=Nocardiopsis sp. FR4 TaxID=2605985 RepID=UPI00135CAD2A|nr:hypothetical protein [Nocardiopsis sp. FR4]
MLTLPHTGMRVPHTGIRVAYVTPTGVGEGMSAVVKDGNRTLGVITISARRDFASLEMTQKNRRILERFADQCRDRDGRPLPHGEVCDLLVAERHYQQEVEEAQREQRVLMRTFSRTGPPELHSVGAQGPVPPGAELQVCAAVELGPDVVRAEAWLNGQWVQVHPVTGTAE